MIRDLIKLHAEEPENKKIKPVVQQLFENSLLEEGDLPEPATMVPRINQILEMFITGRDDVEESNSEKLEKIEQTDDKN